MRQKHAHSWVEAYLGRPIATGTRRLGHARPDPGHRAQRVGRQGRRVSRRTSARSPTWSATSGSSTSSATTPTGRTALALRPDPRAHRRGAARLPDDGRGAPDGCATACSGSCTSRAGLVHQRPRVLRLVRRPAAPGRPGPRTALARPAARARWCRGPIRTTRPRSRRAGLAIAG